MSVCTLCQLAFRIISMAVPVIGVVGAHGIRETTMCRVADFMQSLTQTSIYRLGDGSPKGHEVKSRQGHVSLLPV